MLFHNHDIEQQELADLLGLTYRDVEALFRSKVFLKTEEKNFDLEKCVKAYAGHLRENLRNAKDKSNSDQSVNKDRLNKAKADLVEAEAGLRLGDLVRMSDYNKKMIEIVIRFRTKMFSIPGRAAQMVIHENVEGAAQILNDLVEEACKELVLPYDRPTADDGATAGPPIVDAGQPRKRGRGRPPRGVVYTATGKIDRIPVG